MGAGPPEDTATYCERPGGQKHGPYAYWYENGQKEERGTYVDGIRRGRFQLWDEQGNMYRDVVLGGRLTVCVIDKVSRRSVKYFSLTLSRPWRRERIHTDEDGHATLDRLEIGTYDLEWQDFSSSRDRRNGTREVAVGTEPASVIVEIERARPVMLGPPSPCAMP